MTVILDPQNTGIAGNMVVGALVDLGIDPEPVNGVMEHYASYFGDIKVSIKKVRKSGISASYADVNCQDQDIIGYKNLLEIINGIKDENINENVLIFAKKVFNTLAKAESRVHSISIDKIHFHEVGAADAVADIIGASYCFYELGFDKRKVYGLPPALGGGRIKSKHGKLSVPAPATLEILKNIPIMGGPVDSELTTPTGAALYVNMVDEFCDFYPLITNRQIGYGAGTLDLDIPNIFRVIVGYSSVPTDNVSILETNIDNVTGEVLGHLYKVLMDAGALDVTLIPVVMKKNRPGHLLRVITSPDNCNTLTEAIIRETGSLGVRAMPYIHRNIAERKIIPIKVNVGGIERDIRIKVGMIGDDVINSSPEFEDAKKIAEETGLPLKDVMMKAHEKFMKLFG